MGASVGSLRVGTSGYQYGHWRGMFYPREMPQSGWFEHYASRFDAVEINNTFYRLPEADVFRDWARRAPAGFCYALKFSRYGTHLKHLKDPADTIGAFLDRARLLGPALGPILVQLRPHWHVNADRLARFLDAAPREHRWAVEFRDPTWLCEPVYETLRAHNAALCIHDLIEGHPRIATADWVYMRFHGEAPTGDYAETRLRAEAGHIAAHLHAGRDVYAFFNNDAHGFAPSNAGDLRRFLTAG